VNILSINSEDICGISKTLADAVNAHTKHHMKVVTRHMTVREYPYEHLWGVNLNDAKLRELCEWADVLNFNDYPPSMPLGKVDFQNYVREGKRVMMTFHGTFFRRTQAVRDECQSNAYKTLVTMPIMFGYMDDDITRTEWLPFPIPTDDLRFTPLVEEDKYPYFSICHSPGEAHRWHIKDTDAVVDAMETLGGKVLYNPDMKQLDTDYLVSTVQAMNDTNRSTNMRLMLLTDTKWEDCLSIKQRCTIAFDHLQGYYGVNTAESMSMGLPTICNPNYQYYKHAMELYGNEPPFVVSDRVILADTIQMLREDPELRREIGAQSRDYAQKVHDLENVVMPIYIKACEDA